MFNEFKLNDSITLRNRFVVSPMVTWSSNKDLTVSDDEVKYYAARSKDAGMVITGCTYFQPTGKGFDNQFYSGSDEYLPSLKKLAEAIKSNGAKAILQIFHAGRMGDPSLEELVSASSVKPNHNYFGPVEIMNAPRELTSDEIWEIVNGFYETAKRAIKAGFDGVEIHGANTYLLQQFFSPHSNRRSDEWGGSLEKRLKMPLEVIKAVNRAKKEMKKEDFIIGYRFSPEELEEPGIKLEDTLYLVDQLSSEPIDYLHASLKHYSATSIRNKDDKRIIGSLLKDKINGRKPLIGVGCIYAKEHAEEAIKDVGFELIALGHLIVTDPDCISKFKTGKIPIDTVNMNELDQQSIPKSMAETIKLFPGWFKINE